MDYRHGKCSQCGAGFNIPASFQHDTAKCKECGGVVSIGPVLAAPPAPPAAPARASTPTAPAPSALERLKAERAKALAETPASEPRPGTAGERPPKRMQGPSKAASGGVRGARSPTRAKAPAREAPATAVGATESQKPAFRLVVVLVIAGIAAACVLFLTFKGESTTKASEAPAAQGAPAEEPKK
jgi:hypothetical protein